MDSKEVQREDIIQHEHPLFLEDLQSMYQNYEEDDDEIDDLDLISMQKFKCTCGICGFEIDWYHRYYYKCSQSSCSYSLHKFCKEMSTTFRFPAHPIHTLHLTKMSNSWSCHDCLTKHQDGICYRCSACDYDIDLRCVTFSEQNMIHHPGHPHPLISVTTNPTLIMCSCCGKEHKGVFYHCSTCFNFSIHIDCVTRPFKFDSNHHVHKLTLSYSYTVIPFYSKCKICGTKINKRTWLYKCSKCRYYAHLDCVTLPRGTDKTDANFDAADYPDLLHYPLPDETCNMLPHQLVLTKKYKYLDLIRSDEGFYIHPSHNHLLLLINAPDTSISRSPPTPLHDPMKRTKLLCDGCLRPIMTMPFYVCSKAVSGCCFYLHEWCTSLPGVLDHPYHPQHTLVLHYHPQDEHEITYFWCNVCDLRCNGFGYVCEKCDYRVDVHCAFIPKRILHEEHPNHLLLSEEAIPSLGPESTPLECNACGQDVNDYGVRFGCRLCDFWLDSRCALHLPKTIRNKYDKHPLKLSYSPSENHKSAYFCEVCEEVLIPEKWFYHCQECGQSIHSACAPLILQSEQDVNDNFHREGVYRFINIKFGASIYSRNHQHPMSFLAGSKTDGCCHICEEQLQASLMLKCFQCNDAFHIGCSSGNMSIEEMIDNALRRVTRLSDVPKEEHKHQTFYPSQVTRPVTRH